METPNIVACLPVKDVPDLPNIATYSTYEKIPCPECKELMWLGARSKALLEKDPALPVLCARCLAEFATSSGLDLKRIPIQKLTDQDE